MTAPIVLVAPAMAVTSRYYGPLVDAFVERGWDAVAVGRRGFEADGPTASRRHDWSYADEIGDLDEAVRKARAEEPDRPIVVLGHSLGGQLAAGRELAHEPVDGIVLVGVSVPHFRRYPYGGLGILAMGLLVPVVTRATGYLPKPAFGAPGARTLMREWAGWARSGVPPFEVPERITTPTLSVKLQADAYAVSAATDELVDLLFEPSHVTRWTYTRAAAPEGATTDHVRWVRRPDVVVDRVLTWWDEVRPR